MRVESFNKVVGLYQPAKLQKQRAAYSVGGMDQVQISQTGRDYQIAKKAVLASSDVRGDKVAQLKALVESNEYKVDPGDFAAKLLEKYNAYR